MTGCARLEQSGLSTCTSYRSCVILRCNAQTIDKSAVDCDVELTISNMVRRVRDDIVWTGLEKDLYAQEVVGEGLVVAIHG